MFWKAFRNLWRGDFRPASGILDHLRLASTAERSNLVRRAELRRNPYRVMLCCQRICDLGIRRFRLDGLPTYCKPCVCHCGMTVTLKDFLMDYHER